MPMFTDLYPLPAGVPATPAGAAVLVLEVPAPAWLNANQRHKHWSVPARKTRQVRGLAAVLARAQELPRDLAVPVRVVAYVCRPRGGTFDPNNAAPTTKAAIDGLTDYGCWSDDDAARVVGPDHRAGPVTPGRRVLVLYLLPAGVDPGSL